MKSDRRKATKNATSSEPVVKQAGSCWPEMRGTRLRGEAERALRASVAEGGVVFEGERASLDLFGPFCGNGKKDIQKTNKNPTLTLA